MNAAFTAFTAATYAANVAPVYDENRKRWTCLDPICRDMRCLFGDGEAGKAEAQTFHARELRRLQDREAWQTEETRKKQEAETARAAAVLV